MVGDTRPYFRRRRQKHTQAEFLQVQFITDMLMLVRSWSNVRKHILKLVWCHCFAIHGGHSVTFVPTIVVQIVIHETSRDVLLLGLGQIGLFDSSTKRIWSWLCGALRRNTLTCGEWRIGYYVWSYL